MSNNTNTTSKARKNSNTNAAAQQPATAKVNSGNNAVLTAYTAHCKAIQKQGVINAADARAVQSLMLAGKPTTAEQKAVYNAFAAATQKAIDALTAGVGGKPTSASAVFNLLDGRVTGHKVARGLGNSISMRAFMEGMVTLAKGTSKATSKRNAPAKVKAADTPAPVTPEENAPAPLAEQPA